MTDRLKDLVKKSDRVESQLEQYKDIRKTLEDLFKSPNDEKMVGKIVVDDGERKAELPIEFHISGVGPVNERLKEEGITLKVMVPTKKDDRPADVLYEKTVTSFEKTSFPVIEETLNDDTLTDLISLIKGETVAGTLAGTLGSDHRQGAEGVGFSAIFEKVVASK